jgi:ADP-ribose pyrophosphatase YjhB (NUDIX family)
MALDWLQVVDRLRTIAGEGLTYGHDAYDRDRYARLNHLAAEIAAAHLNLTTARVEQLIADDGYPTPKVDVRAVTANDNSLLFVREASDGLWSLPGGWADLGESASSVAVREVAEESGREVRAVRLLALYDKAKHDHPKALQHVYKVFIQCQLTDAKPTAVESPEILESAWFSLPELPPLSVARVTRRQVARMFELVANPGMAADFD